MHCPVITKNADEWVVVSISAPYDVSVTAYAQKNRLWMYAYSLLDPAVASLLVVHHCCQGVPKVRKTAIICTDIVKTLSLGKSFCNKNPFLTIYSNFVRQKADVMVNSGCMSSYKQNQTESKW